MPIHDWTRVQAGTFHAFHTRWISELMGALNEGFLPAGYYAMAEQVAARMEGDVLTLQRTSADGQPPSGSTQGGLAVADAPPQVRLNFRPDPRRRPRRSTSLRRHIAIRHVSGHRVVALIEIVSPGNKDRRAHVRELTEKIVRNLQAGIHVLVLDLFPPGRSNPHGLHGEIWAHFDRSLYAAPEDAPLTLASYAWGESDEPTAFVEPTAIGRPLIEMPLFLTADRYVNTPLEATYTSAFRGIPDFYRELLEAPPT